MGSRLCAEDKTDPDWVKKAKSINLKQRLQMARAGSTSDRVSLDSVLGEVWDILRISLLWKYGVLEPGVCGAPILM